MPTKPLQPAAVTLIVCLLLANIAAAQCQDEHQLFNFSGTISIACPCFVPGEQAGAIFNIPAEHLPIKILQVGFGWGSQFGGAPQTVENSVNIFGGGLPNPGAPVFALSGPVLTDGFFNEFDLAAQPGEIIVNSNQVTATLTFLNNNAGDIFAPSVVHDGGGCDSGQNVVFAIPGGWTDACLLGVTGNWVVQLTYCTTDNASGVPGQEYTLTSGPAAAKLYGTYPNPFNARTSIQFYLPTASYTRLSVYAVDGRRVATPVDGEMARGTHAITWQGRDEKGHELPSGVYFMRLEAGRVAQTKRVVLLK